MCAYACMSVWVCRVYNCQLLNNVCVQNSTDKVHINTSSSTHRNESVQYMIATIVLTRLRDILAVEAKRQGLSKIQVFST